MSCLYVQLSLLNSRTDSNFDGCHNSPPFRTLLVLALHLHQAHLLATQDFRPPVDNLYQLLNIIQAVIELNFIERHDCCLIVHIHPQMGNMEGAMNLIKLIR